MNANVAPTSAPIVQGPFNLGSGTVVDEVTDTNSCFGAQQGTDERQPKWYKFIAGSNGPLNFSIRPADLNDDYDWAVWDITTDPTTCAMKGNALACNWSGARGSTGLSLCPSLEPGYNQGSNTFDNTTTGLTGANAPIQVQAGRIYALLVDNFSMSSLGFTLTFGGACGTVPGQANSPALIGLDAKFIQARAGCNTVQFNKRNPVDPAVQPFLTYLWTFGDGTTSTAQDPIHTYAQSDTTQTFSVTLKITVPALVDQNTGQPLTYSEPGSVVLVPPSVTITASVDTTQEIDAGTVVTLTASGADRYAWSGPGVIPSADSVLSVTVNSRERYQLIYTTEGCSDTTSVLLRLAPPRIAYNIITPNGDGKNDTFSARVSPLALDLQIFNRWGRKVYDKTNYQQDWNGGDLSAGTYYYHLKATDGKTWKGWVEIVR